MTTTKGEREAIRTLLAKLVIPTTMLDEQINLIHSYTKERVRQARVDAIKSYKKVLKEEAKLRGQDSKLDKLLRRAWMYDDPTHPEVAEMFTEWSAERERIMSDLEDVVHKAAQPFDKHLVNLRVIAGYLAMNLEKVEDEIRETEAARVKALKKAMGKS